MRSTMVIGVVVFGGAYFGGALSGCGWSRTVRKPQSELINALVTPDIRTGPGTPETVPSALGGSPQTVRVTRRQ
jgi:hypothetical protein